MAYQPQPSGPFLKGLVASNQPLAQPKGSFPRGSNLVMMERGALTPCDGSGIINWFNGMVQNTVGRFMSLFLYEPTGVNPYYLAIKQALDEHLGAPHVVSATPSAGGSLVNGQQYFYKITALDGVGGETTASNEISQTAAGGNLSITLVWNIVPNAFGYNVYRGTTTGTEVLLIGSAVPALQPNPLTATVTFIDDGSSITSETFNNVSAVGYTTSGQAYILFTLLSPQKFPSNNLVGLPISSSGFTPSTFNGNWTIFSQPSSSSIIVKGGPGSGSDTPTSTPTTSGPNSPTTATDRNDIGGSSAWVNPNNVFLLDGILATNNVGTGSLGDALQATGYGFAIPATSTITGIEVTIYRAATGTMQDDQVFLVKAGVIVGSNHAAAGVFWPAVITPRTYGSSTDLWGTTWTPSDINNSGFGALIGPVAAGANQAKIDYISITVHYFAPGGGGTLSITATVVPPISDTTQQTVLFNMPSGVAPVPYSNSNIVAFYPASLGALGQVPTGGSGGSGTTGPGINGQGSSTPSGGVTGLVGPLPQFKQFTNRAIISLGNGFQMQVFWDSTGSKVNPAPTGAIASVAVAADVVTVTVTGVTLSQTDPTSKGFMPIGTNVVLSGMSDATYNGTFVVIDVPSNSTFKIRNPTASGGASTGTFTVATTPIVANSSFTPAYPIWITGLAYAVGDIIVPATQPANPIYLTCTQTGVSGAAEPGWNSPQPTIGEQFKDNNIIWTVTAFLNTAAPPPPGAGHIEIYSGSLWAFNTSPTNTATGLDGPTALRMSNTNNPFGWNPVNQAFLDKDDGAEGMGLGKFTITALGIPPEGSLIAFKYRVPYQIIGVFGANNFAIQPVSSDMGCLAPRTIQFVPGYGLMRYCHLGIAVFNGFKDEVISEQIRPYLFPINDFDAQDITVADANYIPLSWAAQTANPPMYSIAIPIGNSGGQLTRMMPYDLILKCWAAPVDLPFPIGCMSQVQPVTSNPLTIIGGFNDGALQRWQAGDTQWYTGGGNSAVNVSWSLRSITVASQSSSQRVWARKVILRGTNAGAAGTITVQPRVSAVAQAAVNYRIAASGDFDVFADVGLTGLRFDAIFSGTVHVEIDGVDWAIEPRPFGVPVGAV